MSVRNGTSRGGGGRRGGPGRGGRGRSSGGARTVAIRNAPPVVREPVSLPPVLTVAELAEQIHATPIEVIRELMKVGIMASTPLIPEGLKMVRSG